MRANSVQLERDLDHQVDRLVAGKSAVSYGDADLRALVATAQLLSSLAATIPAAKPSTRLRTWHRLFESKGASKVRAVALYRLPYLPPLWIRPEAC